MKEVLVIEFHPDNLNMITCIRRRAACDAAFMLDGTRVNGAEP